MILLDRLIKGLGLARLFVPFALGALVCAAPAQDLGKVQMPEGPESATITIPEPPAGRSSPASARARSDTGRTVKVWSRKDARFLVREDLAVRARTLAQPQITGRYPDGRPVAPEDLPGGAPLIESLLRQLDEMEHRGALTTSSAVVKSQARALDGRRAGAAALSGAAPLSGPGAKALVDAGRMVRVTGGADPQTDSFGEASVEGARDPGRLTPAPRWPALVVILCVAALAILGFVLLSRRRDSES